MRQSGQFPAGLPSGKVNVALQRPTVNLKEAENVGAELASVAQRSAASGNVFSKHATFGPKKITHPGIETED
jgi:hypothetical protein